MKGGRSKADGRGTDNKLRSKSSGAGKRKAKAAKDPNKPKRPPSPFFVFMCEEEFRKQFKEAHPNNKSVAAVGKAAGEKWKSMSDEEKAPYVAKAETKKSDYNKNMQAYNKNLADGVNAAAEEDGSDKSKSEINDEDDADMGSAEEDEDD